MFVTIDINNKNTFSFNELFLNILPFISMLFIKNSSSNLMISLKYLTDLSIKSFFNSW